MDQDMPPDVIAEMRAPPARRWVGVGTLYILGALLVLLALMRPPESLGWTVFLLLAGLGALWGAERTRAATARGLRLTETGLWDTGGHQIVALEEIEEVDRGIFAFKPSSGFLLTVKAPKARAWQPGLYWVMGRRIGVGGVTSRAQSKLMADAITMTLAKRGRSKRR